MCGGQSTAAEPGEICLVSAVGLCSIFQASWPKSSQVIPVFSSHLDTRGLGLQMCAVTLLALHILLGTETRHQACVTSGLLCWTMPLDSSLFFWCYCKLSLLYFFSNYSSLVHSNNSVFCIDSLSWNFGHFYYLLWNPHIFYRYHNIW